MQPCTRPPVRRSEGEAHEAPVPRTHWHRAGGVRRRCSCAGAGRRPRGQADDAASLPQLPPGSAGHVRGYFENVAFKSKSIQLKLDASTEIVKFDEATLKVVDVEKTGKGDMLRDIAKGREARIEYTEKDGVKTATLISFKGPIKLAPEKEVKYSQVLASSSRARRSRTPC